MIAGQGEHRKEQQCLCRPLNHSRPLLATSRTLTSFVLSWKCETARLCWLCSASHPAILPAASRGCPLVWPRLRWSTGSVQPSGHHQFAPFSGQTADRDGVGHEWLPILVGLYSASATRPTSLHHEYIQPRFVSRSRYNKISCLFQSTSIYCPRLLLPASFFRTHSPSFAHYTQP